MQLTAGQLILKKDQLEDHSPEKLTEIIGQKSEDYSGGGPAGSPYFGKDPLHVSKSIGIALPTTYFLSPV